MTIVSSSEFVNHQNRYFDLAIKEKVVIERDNDKFHLMYAPTDTTSEYDEILEPDADFYSAISMDEFKKQAITMVKRVHEKYAKK